jgi:purine-binding chemotaxis protein CheW
MSARFCSFEVGSLLIGIPVDRVQEILRYQDVTRVPLVDRAVHGLINLRGQILTAIDLRVRLGLPERDDHSALMSVVVHSPDGAVSLLVERIGEVVEVHYSQYERSPETLTGIAASLIPGTFKLPDRLLHVLDVTRTIDLSAAVLA